ncbi:MAG: glycosyltransferase, partial [Flavobacterium sp.]
RYKKLIINNLQKTENPYLHSGNWLPSNWSKEINSSNTDVVNLHWVAGETLSIEDISRINKPLVWTLHDMWAFCGAEHIENYDENTRWIHGYTKSNRPKNEKGIDINRYAWQRKFKNWNHHIDIITPSSWLKNCVSRSELFSKNMVSIIPNPININIFKPLNQLFCRQTLNLPLTKTIIIFGAMFGGRDPNKGFDLLIESLNKLAHYQDKENILCVIFGQEKPLILPNIPYQIVWMGHIHDDYTLALLYNAASVTVVPSRQENLPQTATEAQSCGCPVVAFNSSGLPDAVSHLKTGYLATPYDTDDMANGLSWVIKNEERLLVLKKSARERALYLWAPDVVIPKYVELYNLA